MERAADLIAGRQPWYTASMSTFSYLDRFLEPMADALSPEVAARIVALRATPEDQARADELARKGKRRRSLTPDEDAEYKEFVEAVDIVSIIQAKARRFLAQHGSEDGTSNS